MSDKLSTPVDESVLAFGAGVLAAAAAKKGADVYKRHKQVKHNIKMKRLTHQLGLDKLNSHKADLKMFDADLKGKRKRMPRFKASVAKKRATRNEDVQLDEISKPTLVAYKKKAIADFDKRMRTASAGRLPMTPTRKSRFAARIRGIENADSKLASGAYRKNAAGAPPTGVKESVDLQELSPDTLKKYIKRAGKSKAHAEIALSTTKDDSKYAYDAKSKGYKRTHKPGSLSGALSTKIARREKGIDTALDKLNPAKVEKHPLPKGAPFTRKSSAGRHQKFKATNSAGKTKFTRHEPFARKFAAEGVVSELKDTTMGSYLEKAAASHKKLGAAQEKGNMKGQKSNMPKLYNRARGMRRAYVKVVNGDYKGMAAHESVKLDELKKTTLAKYVKLATHDMRNHANSEYEEGTQSRFRKFATKMANKRHRGIENAVKKLAKEEVMNELKKSTLASYANKATDQIVAGAKTQGSTTSAMARGWKPTTKAAQDMLGRSSRKYMKRRAGLKNAIAALTKEEGK